MSELKFKKKEYLFAGTPFYWEIKYQLIIFYQAEGFNFIAGSKAQKINTRFLFR
jgi:hypothetical protein